MRVLLNSPLTSGLCFIVALVWVSPSLASNGGVDTPLGVTLLPLSVEGNNVITLSDNPPTAFFNGLAQFSGNVGIGTTNPEKLLDISGPAGTMARISASGTTFGPSLELKSSGLGGGDFLLESTQASQGPGAGAFDIFDVTAWMDRFTILPNGNVGIGTASPAVALDVGGVGRVFSTAGGDNAVLLNAPNTIIPGMSAVTLGYNQTYDGISMTNAAYIQAETQGTFFRNILIDPLGGNVGIGTTAPGATLQVNGEILAKEGVPNPNCIAPVPSGGYSFVNDWCFDTGMFSPADGVLDLFSNGQNAMTVYGGNVGIGTTQPLAQLSLVSSNPDTWYSIQNTSAGGNNWGIISSGAGSWAVPGSFNIGEITPGWTNYVAALSIVPSGGSFKVGINNSNPAYALDVNGTVNASGGAGALSDRRHKKEIKPLERGLDAVEKLKPVNFQWKDPKDDGMKGEQIGFIAQDVQEILPETILTASDTNKTLSIKYNELIPVLTKAIQDQQAEIAAQSVRIDTQNVKIEALEAGLKNR